MRRIARRERVSFNTLWSLRYRPPKDIYASVLFALRDAHAKACEHQLRQLERAVAEHRQAGTGGHYLDQAAAVVERAHQAEP